MRFFSLGAFLAVSISIVAASPTSNPLELYKRCSDVGQRCNMFTHCCKDLECVGIPFEKTCERAGGPKCALEGRHCNESLKCCDGLKCTGKFFKRSCTRESKDCTPQGSTCTEGAACCGTLTCKGDTFGRTCS